MYIYIYITGTVSLHVRYGAIGLVGMGPGAPSVNQAVREGHQVGL